MYISKRIQTACFVPVQMCVSMCVCGLCVCMMCVFVCVYKCMCFHLINIFPTPPTSRRKPSKRRRAKPGPRKPARSSSSTRRTTTKSHGRMSATCTPRK